MNRLITLVFALAILLAGLAMPNPVQAQGANPPQYYVSVGTSLAAGIQMDKKTGLPILTADAYTDQIHQRIHGQIQNLQHQKLGCPGETSGRMIAGGTVNCHGGAPQLEVAEAFLEAHVGEIAFITIDMGANDLLACVLLADPNELQACVNNAFLSLQPNLVEIVSRLQAAAPGVPIIAINYYNPFLADWLEGPEGEATAKSTTNLVLALNSLLGQTYGALGVPVADVSGAFVTSDFSPKGNLPHNVKTICQLTWSCDFDNINRVHPNKNGYKVIARTVEQLMKDLGLL